MKQQLNLLCLNYMFQMKQQLKYSFASPFASSIGVAALDLQYTSFIGVGTFLKMQKALFKYVNFYIFYFTSPNLHLLLEMLLVMLLLQEMSKFTSPKKRQLQQMMYIEDVKEQLQQMMQSGDVGAVAVRKVAASAQQQRGATEGRRSCCNSRRREEEEQLRGGDEG